MCRSWIVPGFQQLSIKEGKIDWPKVRGPRLKTAMASNIPTALDYQNF